MNISPFILHNYRSCKITFWRSLSSLSLPIPPLSRKTLKVTLVASRKSSMANRVQIQNELNGIQRKLKKMKRRIRELDSKINLLIARSDPEAKTTREEFTRLNELIKTRFLQSRDLDEFKKEEAIVNKGLALSTTVLYQSRGSGYGEKELKKADSLQEWPAHPDSVVIEIEELIQKQKEGQVSGESKEGTDVSEGKEQNMFSLISARGEAEKLKTPNSDAKKKSVIEQEGSVSAGDVTIDIRRLEQEMLKPLPRNEEGKEGSEELMNEEDYLKFMNEVQKIDNFKIEKVNKDFLAQIYAKFKKDQYSARKSLVKWIKSFVESDEVWGLIREIMAEAIKLANKLCYLLVTLLFLLSEAEEVEEEFQLFNVSLKCLFEDGDSLIYCTIIEVLELADDEVKHIKTLKKMESRNGSGLKKELFEGRQVDELILQFLDEIVHLEHILMHQGQPDSEVLVMDLLASLKTELEQSEKELKRLESKINALKEPTGCIFGPEDMHLFGAIGLRIDEIWNQVWESEKKKVQKEIDELQGTPASSGP